MAIDTIRDVTGKEITLSPSSEKLITILGHGREHAIGRKMLAAMFSMKDRDIRKMIEQARFEGVLICNTQDGSGYFLPACKLDIKRQYTQDVNRANSIIKRIDNEWEALNAL